MKQETKEQTHQCACCNSKLPINQFYTRSNGALDSYCKQCRIAYNRKQYRNRAKRKEARGRRPIITQTDDRRLRMALILQAKKTIRTSIERKRQRVKMEQEAADCKMFDRIDSMKTANALINRA